MTIDELGAKVKSKYPEYQSLPDGEVGKRVTAKYPQYQSQISGENGVLNTVGSVGDFLFPRIKQAVTQDIPNYIVNGGPVNAGAVMREKGLKEGLKYTANDLGNYLKAIVPPAAEAASYLAPAAKAGSGANALQKMLASGKIGAAIGGLLGATNPDNQTAGDYLRNTSTGVVTGGLISGGLTGLGQVAKGATKKLIGEPSEMIRKVIRPAPSDASEFTQKTGMNFEKEILKRDGQAIQGMDYDQMMKYFQSKSTQSNQAADQYLATVGTPVSKDFVVNVVKDARQAMSPEEGRIGTSGAINKIDEILGDLEKNPASLNPVQLNKLKRDAQDLAKSFYDTGGKPTSASNAFAGVAAKLNDKLEELAPGVKDINKVTQLYHLANDAVGRTANMEANKITKTGLDKLLQGIPAAAGVGIGLATGNPLLGAGTALAPAAASFLREQIRRPEVQTSLAAKVSQGSPRLSALQRSLDAIKRFSTTRGTELLP